MTAVWEICELLGLYGTVRPQEVSLINFFCSSNRCCSSSQTTHICGQICEWCDEFQNWHYSYFELLLRGDRELCRFYYIVHFLKYPLIWLNWYCFTETLLNHMDSYWGEESVGLAQVWKRLVAFESVLDRKGLSDFTGHFSTKSWIAHIRFLGSWKSQCFCFV